MIELRPNSIVIVDDINSAIMTEILRYIYTEQVSGIDNFAPKLIYGAVKYELDGLKELCGAAMIKNLSVINAVDYIVLANMSILRIC